MHQKPKTFSETYAADPGNAHGSSVANGRPQNHHLEHHLVNLVDPEAKHAVEQAVRKWNQVLRDQLREETRFKFISESQMQSVPVRVVDGVPGPFGWILEGLDPVLLQLLLHQGELQSARTALNFIRRTHAPLTDWMAQQKKWSVPQKEPIEETALWVQALIEASSGIDLQRRFRDVQQDILGAYFFKRPKIEIYWVPIALTAKLFNGPVEALAVVVLLHELAHAYTHLGFDIDGRDWATNKFACASLDIVEGLAQFYTSVVTANLKLREPVLRNAYEALLSLQDGPYVVHTEWGQQSKIREVVRGVMNETRAKGITSYADFELLLQNHAKLLGRQAFLSAKSA